MGYLADLFADRIGRMQGKEPTYVPIVHEDLFGSCALNGKDVYDFFMEWQKKSTWNNSITLKRYCCARDPVDS